MSETTWNDPKQTPRDGKATPSQRPVAVFTGQHKSFRVQKDRLVMGSVESADIRLVGEGVSPIHAVLEIGADRKAVLYDLASDSGVFVNGAKGVTWTLKAGDSVTIGYHTLKFSLEDAASTRAQSVPDAEGRQLFMNPEEDLAALLLQDSRGVSEIFDYRPTSARALEVVMSWYGTILDVEHFVDQKAVTIGNARKNDFGIPAILSAGTGGAFSLVEHEGGSFTLNLDPKMSGVVQREGRLERVENLLKQGGGVTRIPIKQGEFAKVSVGNIDFYLSFTAAPPRLKRRKLLDNDPFFMKIMLSSLLLTVLLIIALSSLKVPDKLDAEQVPERIATILYQPEKYDFHPIPQFKPKEPEKVQTPKPPEPPKKVKIDITPKKVTQPAPKTMIVKAPTQKQAPKEVVKAKPEPKTVGASHAQAEAKEGKGARAKGAEGTRGSPTAAKNDEHQVKAQGPKSTGGGGTTTSQSKSPDNGNVDLLKDAGTKIQNLLGASAARLGKGGNKLEGFGGFTTQGQGGLAIAGTGKGGGGNANTLVGGLADSGNGGGRVGTGQGAAGNGEGIVGGRSRVVIQAGGGGESVVSGEIDPGAINAAIQEHMDEFRNCYNREVNADESALSGTIVTDTELGSSGRVTNSGIASSSFQYANSKHQGNVERCVAGVMKRIQFPLPEGSGTVEFRFPFKFSTASK